MIARGDRLCQRGGKVLVLLSMCILTVVAVPITVVAEEAVPIEDGVTQNITSPTSDETTQPESESQTSIATSSDLSLSSPQTPADSDMVSVAPAPVQKTQSPTSSKAAEIVQNKSMQPQAQAVTAQPSPVVANDAVVVSSLKFTQNKGFDYIEVFNREDTIVAVDDMVVRLLYADTATDYQCDITLRGYMLPQNYVSFRQDSDGSDGTYSFSGCANPVGDVFDKEIQVWRDETLIESVRILAADFPTSGCTVTCAWERKGFTATYSKGVFASDFKKSTRTDVLYTSAFYEVPTETNLQIVEVLPHPILCSVGSNQPSCRPYVKVVNTSNEPVDLSRFRLRSGSITSRPSSYNTSALSGIVQANSFTVITQNAESGILAINDTDGATWFEDMFGVKTYTNNDTPYMDAELVAHIGRSWAFDSSDSTWKWATPSPHTSENNFTEPGKGGNNTIEKSVLKPCKDGQYRSEETNRCRSISLGGGILQPCKEGQYRSEETNRCRSIASTAAAVLKPCADDQFRNPETNRCKKIASSEDILQPCDAGFERNLETNRCRKITASNSVPLASFPIEKVTEGAKVFAAWWALGGVLLLGAGYAIWEYHREIAASFKRIASRGKSE